MTMKLYILCVLFSTIALYYAQVKCLSTDNYGEKRKIRSAVLQLGEKTKSPLTQLLKYLSSLRNRIEKLENMENDNYIKSENKDNDKIKDTINRAVQKSELKLKEFIVKKIDTFAEELCTSSTCTDWSEWTICDGKTNFDNGVQTRTRKCGKSVSFCSDIGERRCKICADGYGQDPSRPEGPCKEIYPRVLVQPTSVEKLEGSTINFKCQVSGEGPFNVVWSRLDSRQLQDRASVSPIFSLTITNLERDDTGRYICTATNRYGVTRREVELTVLSVPPSVVVAQRNVYTEVNRIARLQCDVTGNPQPVVRWEKEGDQLPAQHKIQDGVLTIYGVQEHDAGRYICTAYSRAGISRDFAFLHVTTVKGIKDDENVESQYVNVGHRVSMECIVTGTPPPTITWSKDDGRLPPDAIHGDGILIIPQVRMEDRGTYTCLAVNEIASVSSKVKLFVKGPS